MTSLARSILPAPPAAPGLCEHCRTPLGADRSDGFCCRGCRTVHDLLTDSGLARYYALRGDRALAPVAELPAHVEPWLDALAEQLAEEPDLRRFALDIQGLQCSACVWLLDALFARCDDALQVRINPALGQMSCTVGRGFDVRAFVVTVERFGYRLGPRRKQTAAGDRGLYLRTGVCLALAANAMLLSAATYFGLDAGPLRTLVDTASLVLASLSAVIGGSYFVSRSLAALARGVLHLDVPIALGMGLAYAGSVLSLVYGTGGGNYLDTVSVFIALMLVGRLVQERLTAKNRSMLLASDGASSLLARRIANDRVALVPCADLRAGDALLVCPGELVPLAARLDDAQATCTLDWINGESEARRFERGAHVPAGAINAGRAAMHVTALSSFERSDLDALLRDDDGAKARLRGDFWDRLARIYVVLVLLATALGAGAWLYAGAGFATALDVATAILVVTCPCAFGIATPLAYELAVAGLRRRGLFVRDGSFFDRAAGVSRIVFDKTGTLTTGVLALREPASLSSLSATLRSVLYDLCAQSGHPKSAAIAHALAELDPSLALSGAAASEIAGAGIELERGGCTYRLGDPAWALAHDTGCHGPAFSVNGRLLAALTCTEVPRADAASEVRALASEGYELWIASGDEANKVARMAHRLGLPVAHARGDLSPEAKRALVTALGASETLMIGDGINDGPALATARCAGTPAIDRPFVPARVDFYFLTPGLAPVRLALHVARATRRVVRHALGFATAYNVLAVGLCAAGLMRPWLAALLMPLSSALVVAYTTFALSARRRLWTR